jgi:hypothetical protein
LPVGSAPPEENRARDKATQMVAGSWDFSGLRRGDLTSSSFVSESRPSGFLHAPSCGLASSRPGFPDRDYPGKSLETTWPGFGRRASAPIWSYEEVLALDVSHLRMVTQAPLRSRLDNAVPSLRMLPSSRAQEPHQLDKSP